VDETPGLLRRVGLGPEGGAFDALADPTATDALASLLAERLRPLGLDLVVVWEGLDGAVLGYAVGARLGAPVLVLSDDEGLVSAATPARGGTRAALVSPLTPEEPIARMAASYLEGQGVTLAAVATLLAEPGDSTVSHDGKTIALAELAARASDLPGPAELRQLPTAEGR
jgi:hypothetical protein